MYYLAYTLYFSKRKALAMQVVEVQEKRVVDIFPFDCELQSMQLVDLLLITDRRIPETIRNLEDALSENEPKLHRALLYKVKKDGQKYSFELITS